MENAGLPTLAAMHLQQQAPRKVAADPQDARKAAAQFEAYFVSQMMQQMFTDIASDGLFGGGHGEEMFRSLLIDEYGKNIAAGRGIGLADHVMREMLRAQEV